MTPTPPENVRLHLPDGTVRPLEVYYDGCSDGIHLWVVTMTGNTWELMKPGVRITAETLPPKTAIVIRGGSGE